MHLCEQMARAPLEHRHPLKPMTNVSDYVDECRCDICRNKVSIHYHISDGELHTVNAPHQACWYRCDECDFDVCRYCYDLPQVFMIDRHCHPVKIILYELEANVIVLFVCTVCNFCMKRFPGCTDPYIRRTFNVTDIIDDDDTSSSSSGSSSSSSFSSSSSSRSSSSSSS